MKKPIIRWTMGCKLDSGYEILHHSINNIKKLYSNRFEYLVCYNNCDEEKINKLKNKTNINFIKQNWTDCPIKNKVVKSFWKICPPRLSRNTHEIILDNDLIFLKKPEIIEDFLSKNKNLIIEDSNPNTKQTLGSYAEFFEEKNLSLNSGVIGLAPGYDFEQEIIENYNLIEDLKKKKEEEEMENYGFLLSKNENFQSYSEEQGLLMLTLYKTNPLIGSQEDFVGIRPKHINISSLSNNINSIEINKKNMIYIFNNSPVVHFIKSNSQEHSAWNYFKKTKLI